MTVNCHKLTTKQLLQWLTLTTATLRRTTGFAQNFAIALPGDKLCPPKTKTCKHKPFALPCDACPSSSGQHIDEW
eukprot:2511718-Amphidinium_carterae.2